MIKIINNLMNVKYIYKISKKRKRFFRNKIERSREYESRLKK